MKKLFTLVLVISFAFSANAQVFKLGKFDIGYLYLGPKIGGNIALNTVDVGTNFDKKFNLGYQAGAVLKIGITDRLSIEPELMFSSKGYSQINTFNTDIIQQNNYRYFGLPVVAKFALLTFSKIQLYAAGGFYTDVLTGADITYAWNADREPEPWEEEYEETYPIEDSMLSENHKRVDFGLNVGFGINWKLENKDRIGIDLRFNYGTTDLNKKDNMGIVTDTKSKNYSIQLSTAYMFNLTKWFGKNKKNDEESAYLIL